MSFIIFISLSISIMLFIDFISPLRKSKFWPTLLSLETWPFPAKLLICLSFEFAFSLESFPYWPLKMNALETSFRLTIFSKWKFLNTTSKFPKYDIIAASLDTCRRRPPAMAKSTPYRKERWSLGRSQTLCPYCDVKTPQFGTLN